MVTSLQQFEVFVLHQVYCYQTNVLLHLAMIYECSSVKLPVNVIESIGENSMNAKLK